MTATQLAVVLEAARLATTGKKPEEAAAVDGWLRSYLRLSNSQFVDLLMGTLDPAKLRMRWGGKDARRLLEGVCGWAMKAQDPRAAAQIRGCAQRLDPDGYARAMAAADTQRLWLAHGLVDHLSAGIHLAPFLSPEGHPVLLYIDRIFLRAMTEARLGGWQDADRREPEERAARAKKRAVAANDAELLIGWGVPVLPRGVHYAPWRPITYEADKVPGWSLVAIDEEHRFVGRVDLRGGEPWSAHVAAQRELAVILETEDAAAAEPAGYDDGYGETLDDGRDDLGEEWKLK